MAANSATKIIILCTLFCVIFDLNDARSFTIDYENDCFLKDGKPFRYISAGMHYFRVPRMYWKDRLLKIKAVGLNAVQTYIAWNVHEPEQGTYNFEGDADLLSYIKLIQETGLLLILRPGPYICAEWDFGGFPPWLLKNSSIILRSSKDPAYISALTSWFKVLLPKLRPYLYANGGPIISAQVENEYGSYFTCDKKYLEYLQSLFEEYLGKDVILFTTDGDSENDLKCGTLPSLFSTVDFGPGSDPHKAFAVQRKFQAHGPLVNSEYYTGWLDQWGKPHQTRNPTTVANSLDKILAMNASVNMYMFEGGTNFGFMSGATFGGSIYSPCTTSYDYDAPLSEAGDPNVKYDAIKKIVNKYLPDPKIPIPPATPKHAYGKIYMYKVVPKLPPIAIQSKYPLTMEQMSMYYGFVIYSTIVNGISSLSGKQMTKKLSVPGVRDRAIVFVNKIRKGVIYRNDKEKSLDIQIDKSCHLAIMIENQGRINYGHMNDPKGLVLNVTIDDVIITNWTAVHIDSPPDDLREISNDLIWSNDKVTVPAFFKGTVPPMNKGQAPQDTYLLLKGWAKGQAYLNNFNLGRYWPEEGPQITMYVPASAFKKDENTLILLELDQTPCDEPVNCYVEMVTTPILNGTVLF